MATIPFEPLLILSSVIKRRDSVETALDEDAPGLLQVGVLFWCSRSTGYWFICLSCGQVLIQKGVSVNEIKLYGEMESDEALDDSSSENFSELEAIISKVCGFCLYNIKEIFDEHLF